MMNGSLHGFATSATFLLRQLCGGLAKNIQFTTVTNVAPELRILNFVYEYRYIINIPKIYVTNVVYMSVITNMAMMQNSEVIFDKFNVLRIYTLSNVISKNKDNYSNSNNTL
jgi:hypothetical protein